MTDREHTPGPWYVFTDGPRPYGEAEISATVGDMPVTVGFSDVADATRIVACKNACEGFSNASLNDGVLAELVEAARGVLTEIHPCRAPRLQAALAKLDSK